MIFTIHETPSGEALFPHNVCFNELPEALLYASECAVAFVAEGGDEYNVEYNDDGAYVYIGDDLVISFEIFGMDLQ